MTRPSRIWFLVLVALVSTTLPAQVAIDRPRVAVLPVENASGNAQYDAAALTIRDTIVLVLRLIGHYEVVDVSTESLPESYGEGPIAALAESERLDNVIYGEITIPEAGGILFDMSLFDRGVGEIVLQEERIAGSVLDLFDTTDIIVRDFIGAFSGIRIGFGTISLSPSDPETAYNVYVDGEYLGENLRTISQVLIGERRLEIRQVSVGGESTVLQESFLLEENATARFSFALSDLTEADRAFIRDLREVIEQRLPVPYELNVAKDAIDQIDEFLAAHPGAMAGQEALHRDDDLRLALARDFEKLEQYDWTLPPQQADQRRPTYENFAAGVAERASEVIGNTRASDETAVRWEAYRNLAATMEMIRLVSADSVATLSYNDMVRNRNGYAEFLRRFPEPYNYPEEPRRFNRAVQRYERHDRRRRPLWHVLAAAVGMAVGGYGGYIYVTDPITPLLDEADELQVRYETSMDVDEIVNLRSEIESNYQQANIQTAIMWSGIAGGATLVTTAIVARMFSVGRAERKLARHADNEWAFEMVAADQALNAEYAPGEGGVLITNRGRAVTIDGRQYPTPYFTKRPVGDSFDVFGGWSVANPNPGNLINAYAEVVVESGLNIVVLK